MSSSTTKNTLLKLPSELLIAIFEYLPAVDLAAVAASCSRLREIASSDDVWRPRIERTIKRHATSRGDLDPLRAALDAVKGVHGRFVLGMLDRTSKYLGWWASTQAYRGRLVRMSVQLRRNGDIAVCGQEVSCINGFGSEHRSLSPEVLEERWKPHAAIWHGPGQQSYRMPHNHPSPDAGYSIDVLYPILNYTSIFRFTREQGFVFTGRTERNDLQNVSLPIDKHHRRRVNDTAGKSERVPSRYSGEPGPSFPSRNAVRGNVLRPVASFDYAAEEEEERSQMQLDGRFLTAPCFTMQATRHAGLATVNGNSMDYIYQDRSEAEEIDSNGPPPPQAPILLGNPGGNQLFRAFLEGIGAVLPPTMQETIFGQGADDEDEQELFYPIKGPLHAVTLARPSSPEKPYRALELEGIWVGGYSTHGYEFGRIVVRNTWTRVHTADEVALEQIYDDEDIDNGNAEPSLAREPLGTGSLEGGLRKRRTIIEFIKITGDVNVPAGQVSWVAVLPSPEDDEEPQPSCPYTSGFDSYMRQPTDYEPDLNTMTLPTVKRSDWEHWSNMSPDTARGLTCTPRWEEGTVRAAGRIGLTGFVDTSFIDAEATFVREETGNVDEIRVKWFEMGKVSTFRRISFD